MLFCANKSTLENRHELVMVSTRVNSAAFLRQTVASKYSRVEYLNYGGSGVLYLYPTRFRSDRRFNLVDLFWGMNCRSTY